MLHYTIVFLIIALVAALLGFGGLATTAAGIAKVFFVIFLALAIVSVLFGGARAVATSGYLDPWRFASSVPCHRGPDGLGVWARMAAGSRRVALGIVRRRRIFQPARPLLKPDADLAQLPAHLGHCARVRDPLHRLHSLATAIDAQLQPRFLCTLAALAVLLVGLSVLWSVFTS